MKKRKRQRPAIASLLPRTLAPIKVLKRVILDIPMLIQTQATILGVLSNEGSVGCLDHESCSSTVEQS